AAARAAGDLIEDQLRTGEPCFACDAVDHHARDRAFEARILSLERSANDWVRKPSADVRSNRQWARRVVDLASGEPPQSVCRAGVAELCKQLSVEKLSHQRSAAHWREPRLRAPDGRAVACR